MIEHRIQDDDAVVDALSRALADISPLGKRACAAVPAEAAIVKTLSLPASLGEDDIESRFNSNPTSIFRFRSVKSPSIFSRWGGSTTMPICNRCCWSLAVALPSSSAPSC